ncbi:unnamed protein product, partial [Staurois parvus]
MWGDQRVNCVRFYYCVLCVCFTVSALLFMAVLCKAMHSGAGADGRELYCLQTVLP